MDRARPRTRRALRRSGRGTVHEPERCGHPPTATERRAELAVLGYWPSCSLMKVVRRSTICCCPAAVWSSLPRISANPVRNSCSSRSKRPAVCWPKAPGGGEGGCDASASRACAQRSRSAAGDRRVPARPGGRSGWPVSHVRPVGGAVSRFGGDAGAPDRPLTLTAHGLIGQCVTADCPS